MHAQLQSLIDELDAAQSRLLRMAEGTSEEEWSRRPAEGSWSAAECVAHLNLTSEAYVPILSDALERARAVRGEAPARFGRDLLGWLLWKTSGPSGRAKVATNPHFVPEAGAPRAELLSEFKRLQGELISAIRGAEGLPIHRVKIASPFNARAKYSLYSALTILPAHQHRHLGQAERALSHV